MTLNNFFKHTLITASLITSFALSTSTVQASEKVLDGIAAVVNSDIIMVSEVRSAAQALKAQGTDTSGEGVLNQILEKLIMDKIQVQKAKSIGIKIDDVAVNQAMQSIADQNKLDLQQLRVALIKQGLDYKEFRESIRDRLYTDTLRRRQQGRNSNDIGENEVDDLIQAESFTLTKNVQYHLIDIMLPNNNANSVQQFNKNFNRAQQLRTKLLLNPSLNSPEIAKLGASKKDLGWKSSESLNPAYLRTLSLMGEGELSDVIRDTKGFHILKLVQQRGGKSKQTQEARVRHILIKKDDPQARVKVTQLRNRILAGESFSKLAKENSADKGSAIKGGELPMTNTANYVPAFAKTSNTIPLNTISQPIETRFGWHILEVLERRKSDQTRLAIKNQAKSLVGKKKQEEQMNNWLKSLRDEAYVEYRVKL